ncbi:glutathione S-transferase family protein [Enhygromyxa salina]|uniref:Disulfide-bond oxidoreductase YfcG n=1 Tax=Enhygromyxa salina TaxID=215803 RepID=A0A2S9XTF0_9BACT|nr:glutathione S-transferase family protein [Enhygromyxa salina]PRP96146.1 Disulfide-bond oxidoreductase YfcG [Enhygromyxa salina]
MSIVLYHHPWSRAANVVWMLEELEQAYELRYVDILAGEQSTEAFRQRNRMSKLPSLLDGDTVVSETAAIGVYLADRYSLGQLAPALDDPARGPYLRWCFFAPSVLEPGCAAHSSNWDFKPGSVGWGTWENMLATLEDGIGEGPWLLGDRFTMADVILGGTVAFMLQFKMLEARPAFVAYVERLNQRPARIRSNEKNAAIADAHGLEQS